jgi:Na+-driven multidrug efflux pump
MPGWYSEPGEQKRNEAEQVLGNAVSLLLALSVVRTVIRLTFLNPLLRLFGASDTVLPYAQDYPVSVRKMVPVRFSTATRRFSAGPLPGMPRS